jgi:hypothetical protein
VALRIIAFSFFTLAAYAAADAIRALLGIGEAQHSPIGITLAAVSLVIMPVLSYAQRRACCPAPVTAVSGATGRDCDCCDS